MASLNVVHRGLGIFYSMHDQIFPRFFIKAKRQTNKLTRSASNCTLRSIIPSIPFATICHFLLSLISFQLFFAFGCVYNSTIIIYNYFFFIIPFGQLSTWFLAKNTHPCHISYKCVQMNCNMYSKRILHIPNCLGL